MTLGIRHKLEASWGPVSSNTLMIKPIFWTTHSERSCACTHKSCKLYHTASYGPMVACHIMMCRILSYPIGMEGISSNQHAAKRICMMHDALHFQRDLFYVQKISTDLCLQNKCPLFACFRIELLNQKQLRPRTWSWRQVDPGAVGQRIPPISFGHKDGSDSLI